MPDDIRTVQSLSFINTWNFVYLCLNIAFRLTFLLSMQYLVVCSIFILLYDEVKRQVKFECVPLFFRLTYLL